VKLTDIFSLLWHFSLPYFECSAKQLSLFVTFPLYLHTLKAEKWNRILSLILCRWQNISFPSALGTTSRHVS